MSYHDFEPVDPRDAFTVTPAKDDPDAQSVAASQAGLLLAIRAGVLGETATEEKYKQYPLPDVSKLKRTRHVKVEEACKYLGVTRRELREEKQPSLEAEMARLTRELYENPGLEAAAALFEAAMRSPHPLVAVAGASGARETTRLRPKIRETLKQGFESDDHLTSRLAIAAMSQIEPMQDIAESEVRDVPESKKRNRKSDTAVITHGTWASDSSWYKPGGEFYRAVDRERPDLHLHDESFRWSGAYKRRARRRDAGRLVQWLADQGLDRPDFFAHSHGGTVAHLATKRGATFDRLVLMSWPVHRDWYPDFSKVKRIIDIRVRLDLVIMLDRGRQRFRTRQFNIERHRHGWFDHSATHDPDYWDDHGLWGVL